MIILHKKEFLNRVRALKNSIYTDPSSTGAHRTICTRTKRILEAHTYGLKFLTLDRARLLRDENEITIDWKYVRPTSLSVENMNEWSVAVKHVASNVRFVTSRTLSIASSHFI